jgi:hypothetical protein
VVAGETGCDVWDAGFTAPLSEAGALRRVWGKSVRTYPPHQIHITGIMVTPPVIAGG